MNQPQGSVRPSDLVMLDDGVILIDTLLVSAETGAVALKTSHADHFGGAKGLVSREDADESTISCRKTRHAQPGFHLSAF